MTPLRPDGYRGLCGARNMKKYFALVLAVILLLPIAAAGRSLVKGQLMPKKAYAFGDLNIIWDGVPDGDPIFVVSNMLPGDTESRDVTVINDGSSPRDVAVWGTQTSVPTIFPDIVELTIKENGTDVYGGSTGTKTLAQFFLDSNTPGGIPLSAIASGGSSVHTFFVYFPTTAGNEYQGLTIVFDLTFGIEFSVPDACKDIVFSGHPIIGTSGNDNIHGTNYNDLIVALEGNDKVDASNGDDCVIGGPGNDRLDGSNGNDVILGNDGDDKIDGSNGNDLIFGDEGNDTIDASNGNDEVHGGPGNDNIKGVNGNDTLIGDSGTDTTTGGLGTDTCDAETEISCEL